MIKMMTPKEIQRVEELIAFFENKIENLQEDSEYCMTKNIAIGREKRQCRIQIKNLKKIMQTYNEKNMLQRILK